MCTTADVTGVAAETDLVQLKRRQKGWTFLFVAAVQDSIEKRKGFSIPPSLLLRHLLPISIYQRAAQAPLDGSFNSTLWQRLT